MSVAAEIRIGNDRRSKGGAQSSGGDGLLFGKIKLAGLHPKLVPSIPSPEKFQSSCHYPLFFTNSPFVKQVREGAMEARARPAA